MARPPKLQRVDYFPHMCNHGGKTLYILEQKFGNDGYTFWFKLLEKLGGTVGHTLDLTDAIEWELIQARARVTSDRAEDIMTLLVRLDAIDQDLWNKSRIVWCQNLVDNLAEVYRKRNTPCPVRPRVTGAETPVTGAETPVKDNYRAETPVSAPESAARIGQDRIGQERTGKPSLSLADKFCHTDQHPGIGTLEPSPESIITPAAMNCLTEHAWTETLKHYPDTQTDLEEARQEFSRCGSGVQNQIMRGAQNFSQSKRARDGIGIWSLLTFIRKRKYIDWQKAEQPLGAAHAPPDRTWKTKDDQWRKEREEEDRKRAAGELPPVRKEFPWQKTQTAQT
jgi:hypothetical protein